MADILHADKIHNLSSLVEYLNSLFHKNFQTLDSITSDLIDSELLDEIKKISKVIPVYFGKSLRDIKCVITDDEGLRSHTILLTYKDPKKLIITSLNLPYTPLQEREYNSIEEVVNTVKNHVNNLKYYFSELESISRYCTVMEPINPSFKEDYRRILLGKNYH